MAVYFFSGDSFFVQQTLRKQVETFSQKYGKEGIFYVSQGAINRSEIKGMSMSGGLFSSTSLIIVSGVPFSTDTKPSEKEKQELEQFGDRISQNHQHISNFIIFVSPKPDSRTKFCKLLLSSDRCIKKEVSIGKNQTSLIEEYLSKGHTLQPKLLEKYENNSWLLYHELLKIQGLELKTGSIINEDQRSRLLYEPTTVDNFKLYDKIIAGNQEDCFSALKQATDLGDDIYQFLGGLLWYLKGMILTSGLHLQGVDAKLIASRIKYPPFTVYGYLSSLKFVGFERLVSLLGSLLTIEYSIKSGGLDPTLFWARLTFEMSSLKKN